MLRREEGEPRHRDGQWLNRERRERTTRRNKQIGRHALAGTARVPAVGRAWGAAESARGPPIPSLDGSDPRERRFRVGRGMVYQAERLSASLHPELLELWRDDNAAVGISVLVEAVVILVIVLGDPELGRLGDFRHGGVGVHAALVELFH